MVDDLFDGCAGCVGNLFGGGGGSRKAEQMPVFTGGHEFRMHCSVRRPAESTDWSHGLLTLSIAGGTWRSRYQRGDRIAVAPVTTSYVEQHPATPADGLNTTLAMTVIVFDHRLERLELAVLDKDIPSLRKVFWSSWPENP